MALEPPLFDFNIATFVCLFVFLFAFAWYTFVQLFIFKLCHFVLGGLSLRFKKK